MNRRRKDLFVLAAMAFGVTLWFGTDVYAQGGGPCSEDVAKFCKDVRRGGGRIAPSPLFSGPLLDPLVAFREN